MAKIKILHIIKSLGRGGAEVLLPETLNLHDQKKFEFHYIYFLPWKNQIVEPLKSAGGKVTCFEASNNLQLLLQYKKVLTYIKRNEINIIHCHLPWSGFLGRILFRIINIPLIYTEHNIQERYHYVTKFLNKYTFNSQTLTLGVSKDVSTSIFQNIHPKIPVKTLLNGVNVSKFKRDPINGEQIRKKWGIPNKALVVGNVAVFREQKCIPVWLKAFEQASKKNPDLYGILVGAGPHEEEVKQMVKDLNLIEKVKLVGLQSDTISYFSSLDIFMMTSAFEGLPIALLEAMSMECAIIATKAGGVNEVVRDGKDGVLCAIGDWQDLADKINFLTVNENTRATLQKAARERIIDSFGLHGMVENLEELYVEVASGEHN